LTPVGAGAEVIPKGVKVMYAELSHWLHHVVQGEVVGDSSK
jgi:hypothetical protein